MQITSMQPAHWERVKAIYEEGIATGNATFQTNAPSWEEWDKSHTQHCRLVIINNDTVVGWAALTPVSGRCVYAGVAEVSIYIATSARAQGIGSMLMQALITESEQHGFWTLQAGIFPENTASIRLHALHGFREIGFREKIGQMNGIWRNTVLMERRSKTVGI